VTSPDRSHAAAEEASYYRSLLDLGLEEAPASMLERALALLVSLTGAREGYIELHDADGEARWCAFFGIDDARANAIRETISRGIIAEAIATGETIMTPSALADPRFEERKSVRDHRLEAVICAPLGRGEPLGVVYLQGGEGSLEVSRTSTSA
jgi:Nif-specific regulatory protein